MAAADMLGVDELGVDELGVDGPVGSVLTIDASGVALTFTVG